MRMAKRVDGDTTRTIEIANPVITFQPAAITPYERNFGAPVGFHNSTIVGVICHHSFIIFVKNYLFRMLFHPSLAGALMTPKKHTQKHPQKANHPRNIIEGG
jgi:hypothetical protein